MPGPGDHFDLVRMAAHSAVTTNDLLTTQIEEDPLNVRFIRQPWLMGGESLLSGGRESN